MMQFDIYLCTAVKIDVAEAILVLDQVGN